MAADCAAIKAKLDAKIAVLDRLVSGAGVRAVQDSDGSRIEYSLPNINALREQIALLQAEYDACLKGTPSVLTRPIQFVF
jgi:hypothetical protein